MVLWSLFLVRSFSLNRWRQISQHSLLWLSVFNTSVSFDKSDKQRLVKVECSLSCRCHAWVVFKQNCALGSDLVQGVLQLK